MKEDVLDYIQNNYQRTLNLSEIIYVSILFGMLHYVIIQKNMMIY